MTEHHSKNRGKRGHGCVRERPAKQRGPIKTWELRYSLAKDASGKRKMATVPFRGTEKEADREIMKRISAVNEGKHLNQSNTTVSAFIEEWLKIKRHGDEPVTPKTLERYAELLRRHVVPIIGGLKVQKLRSQDIRLMYGQLLNTGRDDGQGLSPQTVRHVHRVLHSALKSAVESELIATSPTATIKAPKVVPPEIEILKSEQIKHVMESLRDHPVYPLMLTALGTGMRRGELLALRWQDVNLEKGEIHVERSIEQTKPSLADQPSSDSSLTRGLRIKQPKTIHGVRDIALPGFLTSMLRQRWKAQQEDSLALGLGKAPPEALVFGTKVGDLRRPDSLTKEWAQAAKSIGLRVTFHALRHTHASQLIASGLDLLTISRRLGHGNPTITLTVYAKQFSASQEPVVKALDAAFSGIRTD